MGINTILVWYFTTLSKSTQLLRQGQMVTGKPNVAVKNIDNVIGIRNKSTIDRTKQSNIMNDINSYNKMPQHNEHKNSSTCTATQRESNKLYYYIGVSRSSKHLSWRAFFDISQHLQILSTIKNSSPDGMGVLELTIYIKQGN